MIGAWFNVDKWKNKLIAAFQWPGLFEVLKTFCAEIAVLIIVFPLLDTFIEVSDPVIRTADLRWVQWSPVGAVIFLLLSIGCAKKESELSKTNKGGD